MKITAFLASLMIALATIISSAQASEINQNLPETLPIGSVPTLTAYAVSSVKTAYIGVWNEHIVQVPGDRNSDVKSFTFDFNPYRLRDWLKMLNLTIHITSTNKESYVYIQLMDKHGWPLFFSADTTNGTVMNRQGNRWTTVDAYMWMNGYIPLEALTNTYGAEIRISDGVNYPYYIPLYYYDYGYKGSDESGSVALFPVGACGKGSQDYGLLQVIDLTGEGAVFDLANEGRQVPRRREEFTVTASMRGIYQFENTNVVSLVVRADEFWDSLSPTLYYKTDTTRTVKFNCQLPITGEYATNMVAMAVNGVEVQELDFPANQPGSFTVTLTLVPGVYPMRFEFASRYGEDPNGYYFPTSSGGGRGREALVQQQ